MKKIIAFILSLALVLSYAAGLAEAAEKTELGTVNVNGEFKIVGTLPEGFSIVIQDQTDTSIVAILGSEDESRPALGLSVVFNDEWADTERLNDVPEEDLAEIEASFREEYEVSIEYRETGHGTKLMVVTETKDAIDFVDIYTIYKGYELEFVLFPGTEPLTEESIQMLIDFITDVDFVEA